MKTSTFLQATAATVLSLLTATEAQSFCAITCFQNVVTEHPPLDCTEENMYLCFCKSSDLQGYFVDCVYSDCPSESTDALDFGVNLCRELGAPITIPPRPDPTTSSVDTSEPTTEPEPTTADATEPVPTDDPEVTSAPQPTAAPSTSASEDSPVVEPTEESSVVESTAAASTGDLTTSAPAEEPTTHVDTSTWESVVSSTSSSVDTTPSGNGTTVPSAVPTSMGTQGISVSYLLATAIGAVVTFKLL